MLEETDYGETGYTLLHVTQEGSPLTDPRVRCALADSTDAQPIIDQTQAGVPPLANGPFSPAQAGNLDDTGFPTEQNMEEAQELIADYKAENPGPLNIRLSTTQDATNLIIAQAQQQFYTEAGVDEVADQPDRAGQVHPHCPAGRLPGVPVAQPRRLSTWTTSTSGGDSSNAAARGRAGPQLRAHQGRRASTRRSPTTEARPTRR